MKRKTKVNNCTTQKGITLIVLVITIIVLLILAGVVINLAIDSNGLFSKANEAVTKWNDRVSEEEKMMQNILEQANEINGEKVDKQRGSIEIDLNGSDGNPLMDVEVTIWKVGNLAFKNGENLLIYEEEFADCGLIVSEEALADPDVSMAMLNYCLIKDLEGTKKLSDHFGVTRFHDLDLGVFFIAQTSEANGYTAFKPFFLILPSFENNEFEYDIQKSITCEVLPVPPPPPLT